MKIGDNKKFGQSWCSLPCLLILCLSAAGTGCALQPHRLHRQPKAIKIPTETCCCPKQFLGYYSTVWHSPEYFGSVIPAACCNRCAGSTDANFTEEQEIYPSLSQQHEVPCDDACDAMMLEELMEMQDSLESDPASSQPSSSD